MIVESFNICCNVFDDSRDIIISDIIISLVIGPIYTRINRRYKWVDLLTLREIHGRYKALINITL